MEPSETVPAEQNTLMHAQNQANNLTQSIEKTKHQLVDRSPLQQGRETPRNWEPTMKEPLPPVRCTYVRPPTHHSKPNIRCGNWSLRGATVCPSHGGRLPNVVKSAEANVEYGRNQLYDYVPKFVDILIDLAENSESDAVRLGAVKDGLDRVGLKSGTEINITVETKEDAALSLAAKLNAISSRNPNTVIDGEVVEDEKE